MLSQYALVHHRCRLYWRHRHSILPLHLPYPSLLMPHPPSALSTRLPVLAPYTSQPSPTLLFFNPHARGHYFLPSVLQQLLALLDGLLVLALPFYAIGVTYYWSYHQSGGDALGALFDSMCGVLHFTLFCAYVLVLLALLTVSESAIHRSSIDRRPVL